MRVMVFGRAADGSENSAPPTKEAFAAMDAFTEELVKAGMMVAGAGLQNNAQAKRITSDGSSSKVVDGPFAETRELVAGFMIWQVKDIDEAVAWAKRNPMLGASGVEIRPFYEAADLAEYRRPRSRRRPVRASAGSSASPDTVGRSRRAQLGDFRHDRYKLKGGTWQSSSSE